MSLNITTKFIVGVISLLACTVHLVAWCILHRQLYHGVAYSWFLSNPYFVFASIALYFVGARRDPPMTVIIIF